MFNDIDRTILAVDAKFYVVNTNEPSADPVLVFNQEQFAQEQSEAFWLEKASAESGIPVENLQVSWTHFRDEDQIRADHLLAYYHGEITKNPHLT